MYNTYHTHKPRNQPNNRCGRFILHRRRRRCRREDRKGVIILGVLFANIPNRKKDDNIKLGFLLDNTAEQILFAGMLYRPYLVASAAQSRKECIYAQWDTGLEVRKCVRIFLTTLHGSDAWSNFLYIFFHSYLICTIHWIRTIQSVGIQQDYVAVHKNIWVCNLSWSPERQTVYFVILTLGDASEHFGKPRWITVRLVL